MRNKVKCLLWAVFGMSVLFHVQVTFGEDSEDDGEETEPLAEADIVVTARPLECGDPGSLCLNTLPEGANNWLGTATKWHQL